jgi:hypothetical protein
MITNIVMKATIMNYIFFSCKLCFSLVAIQLFDFTFSKILNELKLYQRNSFRLSRGCWSKTALYGIVFVSSQTVQVYIHS